MQDFRDNDKKTIKNDRQLAILYFISAYAWTSFFALFLSYVNISKFLKFKMTAKRPF